MVIPFRGDLRMCKFSLAYSPTGCYGGGGLRWGEPIGPEWLCTAAPEDSLCAGRAGRQVWAVGTLGTLSLSRVCRCLACDDARVGTLATVFVLGGRARRRI